MGNILRFEIPLLVRVRYRDLDEEERWISLTFDVDLTHVENSFNHLIEAGVFPIPPYDLWLGIKIEEAFLATFMKKAYDPLDKKQDYGIIDIDGLQGIKMAKSLKIYSFQKVT